MNGSVRQDFQFLWLSTWFSKAAEWDAGKRGLSDEGGSTLPSSSPIITSSRYLLSALCLPHAYLLCKPYFFRTLWITPQLYIKPNLTLPYLVPCPTTKIQSTSSFLAEYHHPAPLYNCHLHSINCPSWPILTWQIKSCTVELNQHQGQYYRSYLKHGGQLSQHSLHIRITWRAL